MSKTHKKRIINTFGQKGQYFPIGDVLKVVGGKNIVTPRDWQNEFDAENNNSQHIMLNAPTGSGKTTAIMINVLKKIKNNTKLTIISAPKRVIGQGFASTKGKPQVFDGSVVAINPENHLCEGSRPDSGNINHLENFLQKDRDEDFNERILVCTHATLVAAFASIDRTLFSDVILWIDESHHSSSDESENRLGSVVSYFLQNDDKDNLSINLATATPFRGDTANIIPRGKLDKFKKFDLSYDRHFEENCNNLSFTYDFLLHEYNDGHAKVLKNIFKGDVKKTIVFIPHPNASVANPLGKHQEFSDVCEAIAGRKNYSQKIEKGILNIKKSGKWIKVLDLITEDGRELRLNYLRQNPEEIDVVVSIDLAKEGFDWVCANREIIIGKRGSLNDLIQMMGRCFRAYKNKGGDNDAVEILQIFPWVSQKKLNEEDFRLQLNDYMKAIYASLVLEMIVNPINVKVPSEGNSGGSRDKSAIDYLKDNLTEEDFKGLNKEFIEEMVDWSAYNEDASRENFEEKFNEVLGEKLRDYNIDEFHDEISESILKLWDRRSKISFSDSIRGIDVSEIDIDLVEIKNNPLSSIIMTCSSNLCDAKSLRGFRDLCNSREDVTERIIKLNEWCDENKKIASRNSNEKKEKDFGSFYIYLRKKYRNNELSNEQTKLLEGNTYFFFSDIERQIKIANECLQWSKINKKRPIHSSLNKTEKRLAIFLIARKKEERTGRLQKDVYDIINKIDGFSFDFKSTFKVIEKLKKWVEEEGRSPSEVSKNEEEKSLFNFLAYRRQKYRSGELSKKEFDELSDINGFNFIPKTRLEKVIDFVNWVLNDNNGFLPEPDSNGVEKKYYKIHRNFLELFKKNKILKEELHYLNKINYVFKSITFQRVMFKVKKVKDFHKQNNMFPVARSKNNDELILANFVNNRKKIYKKGKMSKIEQEAWESIPNWKW